MTTKLIRRTLTASFLALALPLLAATPARAEVPEGWSDPDPKGLLDVLLFTAALPLLVGLVIVLLVYVPALKRGESIAPGAHTEDQWFGGPRHGAHELEASREGTTTGGASGSW